MAHQSRQRRLQEQARPAVLGHHRAGAEIRQAGAHRRQLGQPRPGAAHPPDGRECHLAAAEGCARGDARGDRAVGAALGRARRGAGPRPRPDRHLRQGQRRAGPRQRLHHAGRALPLRPAPGAHRGGHGLQGHRRLHRRHGHPAAAGHRRHHPRVAHARARRRPHAGGAGGAGDPADHGLALVRADRRRLPRLRTHHVDRVPGAGERDPGLMCARACRSGSRNFRAWRA